MTDVRGLAVSVNEHPQQLRRKVEIIRRSTVRVISQTNDKSAAHTPILEEAADRFTSTAATDVSWVLPNDLPNGWNCSLVQLGVGRVSFTPAVGATVNAAGTARSRTQYSKVFVEVVGNTDGQSASYIVSGDIG